MAYKRRQAVDLEYTFPRTKKLYSLKLNTPDTHKVLVQYCEDCVGMLHLVRDWNQEVEASLNQHFNMPIIEEKIKNYKQKIEFLKNVIYDQEGELQDVKRRNKVLEDGKSWMTNFSKSNKHIDDENNLNMTTESLKKWKNIAFMSTADKESTEYNNNMRWSTELSLSKERELDQQLVIQDILEGKEKERLKRISLQDEVLKVQLYSKELETKLLTHNNEYMTLENEMKSFQKILNDMNDKHARVMTDYHERFEKMTENEKQLKVDIAILQSNFDSLKIQKDELYNENDVMERRIDQYREIISQLRVRSVMTLSLLLLSFFFSIR